MTARPPLVAGLPARRDPNMGPPPAMRPRTAAPSVPEPIPARRLDVSLKFTARPVGEVYTALAAAHGVTFEIDPAVDPLTTVSADLGGRNLKDAIAVVSRLAGHKVIRKDDGLYHVFPASGGEPMAEKPVHEEPLPAAAQAHP